MRPFRPCGNVSLRCEFPKTQLQTPYGVVHGCLARRRPHRVWGNAGARVEDVRNLVCAMMQQVSQVLAAGGAVLLFAVSAMGLGGAVTRWWSPDWLLSAPERLALRFLAGGGLLGLGFFLIG